MINATSAERYASRSRVLAARRRLESIPSVDWADYVHYGSPEFRLALVP